MRLLRAAQRHGSGRSRSAAQQRCTCCAATSSSAPPSTMLARLRDALPNARDLHEAFTAIPPGRVIRCANPSSTRPEDVEYLLGELRVRDLIDLRAAEEILEDDSGSALMGRTVMLSYRRGWWRRGQLLVDQQPPAGAAAAASPTSAGGDPSSAADPARMTTTQNGSNNEVASEAAVVPAPPRSSSDDPPTAAAAAALAVGTTAPISSVAADSSVTATAGEGAAVAAAAAKTVLAVRHNISLLDRGRYYISLASRIPTTTTAAAILTNFVNKHAARSMLLPYVNGGGLPMLYEMLLESSRPEMCRVLEVLLAAAESRHCAMFFCRAGKDRTGLVAAMVLSVAGASEEAIVEDYARSDAYHRVALAGLESREELAGLDRATFERAPPEVMRATLEHVRRRYGSISEYLTGIGFGPDRQRRLREVLTSAW
ncbi:hypothetical protein PLESTB_000490800 [Pleodorina starrii]|uniref:Tyrosine specific protein phosphatases domain-containing protein n=1 Tax=Pleodorina starrii TaxID=330485 RepID=A0A9W6F0P6_9CHLO|nr:hypothetical protein PLESTM_000362300 [Pleodorina starrii]GLC51331.1 hypothetical protein PLESTB_000490800 [Pleodorina starrii]GLC63696.1 hypothetical protein PLESTF_000064300 [Pleodorina starrii]